MRYSIYTLFDIRTGLRFYVGCTSQSLILRHRGHRYSLKYSQIPLYKYIRKNKIEFDIAEIDSCETDVLKVALAIETKWIDFFRLKGNTMLNMNAKRGERKSPKKKSDTIYEVDLNRRICLSHIG